MKKTLLCILVLYTLPVASNISCINKIKGYHIVKDSVSSFYVDKEPACFFAFYTPNPEPTSGVQGNGNLGDTFWYAYYKRSDPTKIYQLPKPLDNGWANICEINAISFHDMNGDRIPDITVIGACNKQNLINYNFPLVFIYRNGAYFLDLKSYNNLHSHIALTIAGIRAYIASPETYQSVFDDKN